MAPLTSLAQTFDELEAEVEDVAQYAALARPVFERVFEIIAHADPVDQAYDKFYAGEISEQAVRDLIVEKRASLNDLIGDIKADYDALPPAPSFSFNPNNSAGVSEQNFNKFLNSSERFTRTSLNMTEAALDGDMQVINDMAARFYHQSGLMIDISNTLLRADRNSIKAPKHPQRSILNAQINTNEVVLMLLHSQQASILDLDRVRFQQEVENAKSAIEYHREILRAGRNAQNWSEEQLERALIGLSGSELAFLRKIAAMMKAYDKAWLVEEDFISIVEPALIELETLYSNENRLNAILDDLFTKIESIETRRYDLIYERIELLQ
ncbi:MAG: hypothetical protein AAGH90_04715 [Pseudomonadota bacterium]